MGTIDEVADRFEAAKQHLRQPINHVLPPSLLLYLVPPLPSIRTLLVLLALSLLVALRIWYILPSRKPHPVKSISNARKDGCTVGVFLGSGGHTTELLQLVSALPTSRYTRRIYLVSSGDKFSLNKAKQLESKLCGDKEGVRAIQIPRARNVHQSFLTAPLTTAYSIAFCVYSVALLPLLRPRGTKRMLADVILMNGPGTCVPIVAAVYLLRILGLPSPKLMYIESFARVTSLSLTAKLVRPLVDRFVLQWPRQPPRESSANTVYSGWLI